MLNAYSGQKVVATHSEVIRGAFDGVVKETDSVDGDEFTLRAVAVAANTLGVCLNC